MLEGSTSRARSKTERDLKRGRASQPLGLGSRPRQDCAHLGNSFWLASQLAYLTQAWICEGAGEGGRRGVRRSTGQAQHRRYRGGGGRTLLLVRRMISSNSWRLRARYSCSSSKSSMRCLGLGVTFSWKSAASRKSCSAVICVGHSRATSACVHSVGRGAGSTGRGGGGGTRLHRGRGAVLDAASSTAFCHGCRRSREHWQLCP